MMTRKKKWHLPEMTEDVPEETWSKDDLCDVLLEHTNKLPKVTWFQWGQRGEQNRNQIGIGFPSKKSRKFLGGEKGDQQC
ncbi:hypothetical protein L596_024088 [Steinernema carpocapsae]|uniref:Uncharacterized protein n=1 Tax=Steinernema carpocapsae TaxID=34508 RepID=A0A4U5MFP3_STECR|nr:hypothetical protein L596_024088 [Steinernema carpocapsae]